MNPSARMMVFEDDLVSLEHSEFCRLPGYLVLRLKTGARSFGDLEQGEGCGLGALLCAAAAAIETVVAADRVYCLSFCELDRGVHFHLFPRSAALLVEYHNATGTEHQPVNGPMLFGWARAVYGPDAQLPPGFPEPDGVCAQLREILRQRLSAR